jgi:transposase-like protein
MAKRPKPVHQLTVKQFEELFPHEDACKAYLQARRWPEGPGCPRCGNPAVYDLPSRKWHWQCEKCTPDGYRFSILVGTIFENTNKPLRDWFRVAHLMLTSKKGMSAVRTRNSRANGWKHPPRGWTGLRTKRIGALLKG